MTLMFLFSICTILEVIERPGTDNQDYQQGLPGVIAKPLRIYDLLFAQVLKKQKWLIRYLYRINSAIHGFYPSLKKSIAV